MYLGEMTEESSMDSVAEEETVEAKVLVIKNSWKNCPPEQVYNRS